MALNLVVTRDGDQKVEIDAAQCNGCNICAQLCNFDAIILPDAAEGGKA
jgi:Pyruvate/2-oxoacid:ferredoxin oxidoreductase delta subunit